MKASARQRLPARCRACSKWLPYMNIFSKNQRRFQLRLNRAFFSEIAQGASAKTVCTIRRARSDTGQATENALNQHRAQTGRCIPLHPLLRHKMTDESLKDALFGRHYAKEARAMRVFNQNRWKVFNFQCFDPVCMRFNIDPHKAYS